MYRTYCSCDCKGRLYIGYTSKPESSDYMGSYSDKTFEPKHSFTLSRHSDRAVALLQESGLQRAWGIPGNKRFANKARATAGHYVCHGELNGEKNPMYGKPSPMRGKKLSDETKARISTARKGRKHTAEAKARMSAAQKGENNPMYGKQHTDEAKALMSAIQTGENNPMFGKKKSDLTRLRTSIATTISQTKNITQAILQQLEQKLAQLRQMELATEVHTSDLYEKYSISYAEMCRSYKTNSK